MPSNGVIMTNMLERTTRFLKPIIGKDRRERTVPVKTERRKSDLINKIHEELDDLETGMRVVRSTDGRAK